VKPDGDMLGALWTLSPRGRNRILDEAEGVERMRRGDRQEGGRTGEEAADADRLGDSSDDLRCLLGAIWRCLLGAKHEHPIPLFYTCQHILNF